MTEVQIPISAESFPLGKVLSGATFKVPDFQRPYSWGEDQVKDLWDDLLDSARPANPFPHFFGTLLTVDADGSPLRGSNLHVLDGQQRLTTFTLLLIALDRRLEELDSPDASKRVREGVASARDRVHKALHTENGLRRLRLRTEDDHVLANIISGNPGGSNTVGRAFARLKEHVDSRLEASEDAFGEVAGIVEAILDRSVVIHAHCKAGFDPFVVFSTLNATGLPLTASQILRARTLGLVHSMPGNVPGETKSAWDEVETLNDDADRFLQAFLVLNTGDRIQIKDVVRTFDREILKSRDLPSDPETHFLHLARELERLVPIYKDLIEGRWPRTTKPPASDWHEQRVRLLVRTLGIKQMLPLLLASAGSSSVDFGSVMETVEQAAFVALVCFENQTKWGEMTFDLASEIYKERVDTAETTQRIQSFFAIQLLNPGQRFAARLPELLRYNGRRKTLIRYFLTTMNDWGYGELDEPPQNPDIQATWVLSDIHIDHISAQRGADLIDSSERDRLGNLTPLKGRANVSLSNKPFGDKLASYRSSPLRITRALSALPDWDLEQLERREQSMVRYATELFCRELPPAIRHD
jgi:hypothetical protein